MDRDLVFIVVPVLTKTTQSGENLGKKYKLLPVVYPSNLTTQFEIWIKILLKTVTDINGFNLITVYNCSSHHWVVFVLGNFNFSNLHFSFN